MPPLLLPTRSAVYNLPPENHMQNEHSNMRTLANKPFFRPPAEANSLILQIDEGCPWNRCSFCGMYKTTKYRVRSGDEVAALIRQEALHVSHASRIFLADGDVMRRPYEDLLAILHLLAEHFPRLTRVSLYANGASILVKSTEQLENLKACRLHTLYMGLESGDETILQHCSKGETAAIMANAARKAQAAGLRMSVMVLLGLGGTERSHEHAVHTAETLNRMQPRLLSALRVIPVPGTRLYSEKSTGTFQMLSEHEIVNELRVMISLLDLRGTVFRANHNSNIIPLEARFPQDKQRLLSTLDDLLASDRLDRKSPGPMPMSL